MGVCGEGGASERTHSELTGIADRSDRGTDTDRETKRETATDTETDRLIARQVHIDRALSRRLV